MLTSRFPDVSLYLKSYLHCTVDAIFMYTQIKKYVTFSRGDLESISILPLSIEKQAHNEKTTCVS